MTEPFTFLPDLGAEASLPERGIHSQTVSERDGVELILFAMASGERISEHTAARPAIVHVLRGSGDLTVGGQPHAVGAGSWLGMAARTPHAIAAREPMVFALYLFGG